MMNKSIFGLAVGLAATLITGVANATLLSFAFSGSVSSIISDDSSNTFSTDFATGNTVTGTWSVDTAAVDQGGSSTMHYYDATFSVTINGKTFSGPAQYRIFNDDPGGDDGFSIINESGTYTGPALGPLVPSTFFIQYLGMPATTLSDFSLITDPVSLISLANTSYAPHGFRLDNPDGSFGGLYFTIDQVRNVPEPGTLALLGLGLAGFLAARRRNH